MAQRTVNSRTTTYRTEVQGNVVRNLQAVPERRQGETGPVEVPRRSRKQVRNTLSIPYCIFLAVACVLTLTLGAYYLEQQALATSSQKKIASLESQLAELRKTNADELNRIETSVNLEEIREIAMNELGMVYATEENVVLYENTRQNYVSQYNDIPQEEDSLLKSILNSSIEDAIEPEYLLFMLAGVFTMITLAILISNKGLPLSRRATARKLSASLFLSAVSPKPIHSSSLIDMLIFLSSDP